MNSAWADPVDTVIREVKSSMHSGLDSGEASRRLNENGLNQMPRGKQESPLSIFLRQFKNPLIYVLLASTLLALALGKVTDGLVIFGIVFFNSIIGFIQEHQAERSVQALHQMIPENSIVIRDGIQKNIPSTQLVPGDLVVLQAGDRISADLRLTETKNLQCDESTLTGESVPVLKQAGAVATQAVIADRTCMAFGGTVVTAGYGKGIVISTGGKTEFGKISDLLEKTPTLKTPLVQSLEDVAKRITFLILSVVVLLFVIGIARGYELLDAALSGITLAVATIPEGLPAIITIASAIGVRRMARRKAIIRQLTAVETLGSTTVICSDKTGTLTQNKMTVQSLWTSKAGTLRLSETDLKPNSLDNFSELLKAGVLSSDASLESVSGRKLQGVGDPTEVALVLAAHQSGIYQNETTNSYPRLDVIPFESERKFMATLHRTPDNEQVLFLKGAPEAVIDLCSGTEERIQNEAKNIAHEFAENGLRVIAIAKKKVNSATILDTDLSGCTLLGLEAMIDPPREEAMRAIKLCQDAGIIVKMITGDHPETARAIAVELHLAKSTDEVITGINFQKMNEKEIELAASRVNIFARVAPEHKLKLVQVLQRQGHVVAMTGDGVNDAPALKMADIGIAMGISGTAVAKEASKMVLGDDNFASIEAAVEEGRRVYDNLLKSIAFILPTSLGQGLVILISVIFFPIEGQHLLRAMEPIQALWVNLITGITLAVPLAFETMEPDVMQRPPRMRNVPILSRLMIFRIVLVSFLMAAGTVALFLWEYYSELERGTARAIAVAEAQSMAVTVIVFFQIFYLINCRSLKYSMIKIGFTANKWIFIGIAFTLVAQLGFIYLPFMQIWFHSAPLKIDAWLMSLAVSFIVFPVIAFEKWLRLKMRKE